MPSGDIADVDVVSVYRTVRLDLVALLICRSKPSGVVVW
jgi:hypothetical protein